MDFQIVGEESLRIKSKKASLAIDPREKITKIDADAVLLTDKLSDVSRVNDYRIIIDGPGEYEIGGLKISAIRSDDGGTAYELVLENSNMLVARASTLAKMSPDKLDDYKIVVINADSEVNQSIITSMEPRVVVLYGEQKKDGAKKLGSDIVTVSAKISLAEGKFPDELEVMLLG